jgi:hypothetical protein
MSTGAYERMLDHLEGVKRTGNKASARCPAHDDHKASLSVSTADQFDGVVVHCHVCRDADKVLDALNLTRRDLFDDPRDAKRGYVVVDEYPYQDESGKVLYFKERRFPKDFRQYQTLPDGSRQYSVNGTRRVLYRLPKIIEAIAEGSTVYVAEGEKDVEALEQAGVTATTWSEGAWGVGATPKWRNDYSEQLAGANVIIVRDRDENGSGQQTAKNIATALKRRAASVKIAEPVEGKDAYDHLAAGHKLADFVAVNGDEDEEEQPKRRIQLTPLSTIKPRPVRWAWTDRVPAGELTLTPGRGGVGKSTFHAWVIAHLTRGTLPGVHFGTPKPCIIAATEDSWERTIIPRLIAAGADTHIVYRVDVITETNEQMSISLPRDIDGLIGEINRIRGALLSVDPVMSALSSELDTHKDREVRLGLEPLGRLADRTGCAVLGNAHFNKSAGSDILSLIMGSSAFGNVARAALGFARDTEAEDGACVISQAKNNLGRMDLPSLRYSIDAATIDTDEGPAEVGKLVMLGESDRSVADILRDSRRDAGDPEEHRDAASWIKAYLTAAGGTAPVKEVLTAGKAAGYVEQTLKNARRKVADTDHSGFGKNQVHTWILRRGTARDTRDTTHKDVVPQVPLAVPLMDSSLDPSQLPVPLCTACGAQLWAPDSQQRGTCHRCWKAAS